MAGTLDTTFGTNGYTLSDMGGNPASEANAQVIDSNNCTIVTGVTNSSVTLKTQLYLAKYTSKGILDTTFGAGKGYVIADYYTGQDSEGNSLVLDSTGNILVTGYTYDSNGVRRLLLAKYNSNGELDTSFGGGKGWLTSDFGYSSGDYSSEGNSLALDSSGRIVVTGYVNYSVREGNPVLFVLARYTSSGDLDKTFGGNGTGWSNITDSTINSYVGESIMIEKTIGSIIVGGVATAGGSDISPVLVAKFNNNGILDVTFGGGKGYIIVAGDTWSSRSEFAGFILDKFNRIIVTSSSVGVNTVGTLLVRYTSNGTLDTTFGENNGTTITTIPNYESAGRSLVIDSNDRIIVTGYVNNSDQTIYKTLLLRYTTNGKLDTTFGGSGLGYSINSFGVPVRGYEASVGYAVSLDNNGLIVVSGYASVSTGYDSFIARFYNSDIVTTTSTTSTTTIPYSTTSTTTHYQPICLVAGTPILTDQGILAIENIDPKKHTINHKSIVAITKSITPEDHLVVIEANSFGPNVPTQRTIMTPGHHIMVKGSLVPSKNLLGRVRGVHSVPYNGKDVLYNVLMEKHDVMIANNMVIETLHPTNKVARRIISELNKQ